jgi:hypothetical protein
LTLARSHVHSRCRETHSIDSRTVARGPTVGAERHIPLTLETPSIDSRTVARPQSVLTVPHPHSVSGTSTPARARMIQCNLHAETPLHTAVRMQWSRGTRPPPDPHNGACMFTLCAVHCRLPPAEHPRLMQELLAGEPDSEHEEDTGTSSHCSRCARAHTHTHTHMTTQQGHIHIHHV